MFHFVLLKSGLIGDCSEMAASFHSILCNFCTMSLGFSVTLKCIKILVCQYVMSWVMPNINILM